MDKKMLEKRELKKQKQLEAKPKLEEKQKIREAAKGPDQKTSIFISTSKKVLRAY